MSLYPSLEDMHVSKMMNAQQQQQQQSQSRYPVIPEHTQNPYPQLAGTASSSSHPPAYAVVSPNASMYPDLNDYMGLDVTNLPADSHVVAVQTNVVSGIFAIFYMNTKTKSLF